MVPWLEPDDPLPATRRALGPESPAPGLLAASAAVSLRRLEEAYRHGVFPWYSAGQPVLWWSPDPRMVLTVGEFHVPKSLRKTLRRFVADPCCQVRVDSAFDQVIAACASTPRLGQGGTWIVPEMIEVYRAWHRMGRVHSVETWIDGQMAGGLYGVSVGRMFFGESMFARQTDASKIALCALVCLCRARGIAFVDCQQNTRHLASLGAREWPRAQFEQHLAISIGGGADDQRDEWTYHHSHWRHLGIELPIPAA